MNIHGDAGGAARKKDPEESRKVRRIAMTVIQAVARSGAPTRVGGTRQLDPAVEGRTVNHFEGGEERCARCLDPATDPGAVVAVGLAEQVF